MQELNWLWSEHTATHNMKFGAYQGFSNSHFPMALNLGSLLLHSLCQQTLSWKEKIGNKSQDPLQQKGCCCPLTTAWKNSHALEEPVVMLVMWWREKNLLGGRGWRGSSVWLCPLFLQHQCGTGQKAAAQKHGSSGVPDQQGMKMLAPCSSGHRSSLGTAHIWSRDTEDAVWECKQREVCYVTLPALEAILVRRTSCHLQVLLHCCFTKLQILHVWNTPVLRTCYQKNSWLTWKMCSCLFG